MGREGVKGSELFKKLGIPFHARRHISPILVLYFGAILFSSLSAGYRIVPLTSFTALVTFLCVFNEGDR